ncbi:hypothetical protein [Undibacterium sp. Di24W]|uniref:hypothetical protein n=1 Tax=Undibacterium sp. Di24W TaxID=3413033 RepID=UPI003BF20059
MEQLTFSERLILALAPVLVTALLAGLIAPLILKFVEAQKTESLKRLEAALSRQTKVIEAQSTLLDELTRAIWGWRYLIMRVTHAGSSGSQDSLNAAWNDYSEKVWASLHDIRVQVTRSRRLVSQTVYESLHEEYKRIVEIDRRLYGIMQLDGEFQSALSDMNNEIYTTVSEAFDAALHMVATEVQLTSSRS